MTAMSAQPTRPMSYRIGYSVGTFASACLRSLKDATNRDQPSPVIPTVALPVPSTRNDWDKLSRTPTLARLGVDLNRWYDENTKEAKPDKPKRKRSSARKAAPVATLFVGPLPKYGPLDPLIA